VELAHAEMMVSPDSSSVRTRKVGSSLAKRWSALARLAWALVSLA
jgi:hypothetical protein